MILFGARVWLCHPFEMLRQYAEDTSNTKSSDKYALVLRQVLAEKKNYANVASASQKLCLLQTNTPSPQGPNCTPLLEFSPMTIAN